LKGREIENFLPPSRGRPGGGWGSSGLCNCVFSIMDSIIMTGFSVIRQDTAIEKGGNVDE
jgi:hypothetical protein